MKKKYTFYALIMLLIGSSGLQAQDRYKFSYNKESYTPLENATDLTTTAWSGDDQFQIPLSFPIYLFGQQVDQLFLIGGVLAGVLVNGEVGIVWPQSAMLMDLAYPVQDDDVTELAMSPLLHKTAGENGARILKIEVKDAISVKEVDSLDTRLMRVNYQIWFREDKKDIEIRYGENSITDFNLFFNAYDQGTETDLAFLLVALVRATDTLQELFALEGTGNNPILVSGGLTNGLTSYPDKDMVYVFGDNLSTEKFTEPQAAMFGLYPNPTTDHLWVTFGEEDTKDSRFDIFNILGRKVQSGHIDVENPIDVSALKSGIYFIRIDGTQTKRFIKK